MPHEPVRLERVRVSLARKLLALAYRIGYAAIAVTPRNHPWSSSPRSPRRRRSESPRSRWCRAGGRRLPRRRTQSSRLARVGEDRPRPGRASRSSAGLNRSRPPVRRATSTRTSGCADSPARPSTRPMDDERREDEEIAQCIAMGGRWYDFAPARLRLGVSSARQLHATFSRTSAFEARAEDRGQPDPR